ncbi:MAG: DUF354 domain-containing protein [Saprospirales bacterium]|nr:DUF354 domain-containing protein [Saprospirales bacterium]
MMRVIFDIGHPAHVHLFKHLARLLMKDGAVVLFTARDKEFELDLLKAEGFEYESFGKHYRSLWGKIWGLVKYDIRMFLTGLRFKPDLLVSHGTIYAAHAAPFLGAKYLSIEDTGNMEQVMLYRPFTDVILTPEVLPKDLGPKQIRYNGYHELAYLHPEFFTPDPAIHSWLGVEEGEPYAIIRFISWEATHDVGHKGMTTEDKINLVKKLSEKMRVFITAERAVTEELQPFCMRIPPDKFHHALNYAAIVISEGTTTGTEAGILGTPCVYISTFVDPNLQEMEQYDLVYNTSESQKVFAMVDHVLAQDRESYREKARAFVASKVNVSRYYYEFITNRYSKKSEAQLLKKHGN